MARPILALLVLLPALAACSSSQGRSDRGLTLADRARDTRAEFLAADDSVRDFFDTAAGYAVFPSVAKGAAGIGAARGRGVVFGPGREVLGSTTLTAVNIGFQLGGQAFSQVIFFETPVDLERFQRGEVEFDAGASAVAADAGATARAAYEDGVAVFVMGEKGLMFEASIGGQSFSYQPLY